MRRIGLILFAGSAAAFIALLWAVKRVPAYLGEPIFFALVVTGGSAALSSLMVATGLSPRGLSVRWNALHGWQRGVFGTVFVVIVALALFVLMSQVVGPVGSD